MYILLIFKIFFDLIVAEINYYDCYYYYHVFSCRQCLNEYIAQTSDVFRKNEGYPTEVIEEINVLDNYNQDFPALFTSTVKKWVIYLTLVSLN